MLTVCLCSTAAGAGKSANAIALGKRLLRDGYRLEYVSTVAAGDALQAGAEEASSAFVRGSLGLGATTDPLFPISLSTAIFADGTSDGGASPSARLLALRDMLSARADLFLVETGGTPLEGALLGISAPEVVRLLEAKPLIVAAYTGDLVADSILGTQRMLGVPAVGTVVVGIPQGHLAQAQRTLPSLLGRRGMRVFGLLPEDRLLAACTVAELADALGGHFLCCAEQQGDLIEHLMIGAMEPEHALSYFRRVSAKAVITGGDRPAIQLAALETATRCLILTGGWLPDEEVISRATELRVPVIAVDLDTLSAVERAQRLFGQARFRQEKKIGRLVDMFDRYFDFASLYSALGITPRASQS